MNKQTIIFVALAAMFAGSFFVSESSLPKKPTSADDSANETSDNESADITTGNESADSTTGNESADNTTGNESADDETPRIKPKSKPTQPTNNDFSAAYNSAIQDLRKQDLKKTILEADKKAKNDLEVKVIKEKTPTSAAPASAPTSVASATSAAASAASVPASRFAVANASANK